MIIENSKIYDVNEVERLFFRPSFCGKSAEDLGIRVIYNMPVPTKVPVFTHQNNILREFSSGWNGGISATFIEKEIEMSRLKAEVSYSAESYFNTIYELITNSADVNLGDLSGTDLEKAETELFRRAIVDNIYATMWFGDIDGVVSNYKAFNGFIRKVLDIKSTENPNATIEIFDEEQEMSIIKILQDTWVQSNDELRSLASDGNLVYFVSSDIYDAYQFFLDEKGLSNNAECLVNGRKGLYYHGIPLVELPHKLYTSDEVQSFCILTDRRNFILALNTADSPEKEIRMWYNPDEMENRQRVVFLAGVTIADSDLVSVYIFKQGVLTEGMYDNY